MLGLDLSICNGNLPFAMYIRHLVYMTNGADQGMYQIYLRECKRLAWALDFCLCFTAY